MGVLTSFSTREGVRAGPSLSTGVKENRKESKKTKVRFVSAFDEKHMKTNRRDIYISRHYISCWPRYNLF